MASKKTPLSAGETVWFSRYDIFAGDYPPTGDVTSAVINVIGLENVNNTLVRTAHTRKGVSEWWILEKHCFRSKDRAEARAILYLVHEKRRLERELAKVQKALDKLDPEDRDGV